MSGAQTAERPRMSDQFARNFGGGAPVQEEMLPAMVPVSGGALDRASAQIVTAQRCPIKRDLPRILKEIDVTAEAAASSFYYQWPTRNRDGSTGIVEGPSIDCAMALVNIWGNCSIEAFPAQETPTHWVFLARFVDYEKGVTVTRSFQQRKNQRAGGGMEGARAEDIAFQIGQSKAMRNAVVAGLKIYADRAVEAAKASAFNWVKDNIDRARQIVLEMAQQLKVPTDRMERAVARKADQWLAPDLLSLRAKLQSIQDGFLDVDMAFPLPEDDEAEGQTQQAQPKQDAAKQPEPDAKPKRQQRAEKTQDKPAEQSEPAEPEKQPETAAQPEQTREELDPPRSEKGSSDAGDDGFGSLEFQ